METGDGLVQRRRRVARQLVLEGAEGLGHGVEVLLAFHLLQADRPLHKDVGPPGAAVGVGPVGLAVAGGDDVQSLPLGVAAPGDDLPAQIARHPADVLHQAGRVGEGVGVDPLQDPPAAAVGGPDREGVVDVAGAVAFGCAGGAAEGEGAGCLLQQGLGDWFHGAIPP